jgi:ABC-type Fe3+-siderophore transport system permease subunit
MNEMYNMSIVTHYYSVWAVLGVILLNLYMLNKASCMKDYKRFNSLFMPIGSMFIGGVIFTGIIMMAAKHLEFSIENIIMIIIGVYVIVLEASRSKKLKYLSKDTQLCAYKTQVNKIFLIQSILVIAISIWMLI